jgi:hypothetical protein
MRPTDDGVPMMRTLDRPLDGLGRQLVVSRRAGPAGPWFEVTWPGLAGATTALAPGRFSGALIHAPRPAPRLRLTGGLRLERWRLWRSARAHPAPLLRRAFDECASFDDAMDLLSDTPLSGPAIYTLAGADGASGVVIERWETVTRTHPAPVCVANHGADGERGPRARGRRGQGPLDLTHGRMVAAADGMAWLAAPLLEQATRLAVTANAATGELTVQGFENGAPTTSVLRLVA